MRIVPYPHQTDAVESAFASAALHPDQGHLIVLPTASGKSVINAEMCRVAVQRWNGRALMLVRSQELVSQNMEKMLNIWPEAPLGINSASLGMRNTSRQILFATIGSVARKAHELGQVDMVIVDEAHHISTANQGSYRKFLADLRQYNPHFVLFGMTATPYRGNGVWLTDGEDPIFHRIAYEIKMRFLLDHGYLAPLVLPDKVDLRLDSRDVRVTGGDYVVSDLAAAHDKAELVNAACDEIVRLGSDRKSWIVFGITIDHCEHIRDALIARGIDAAVISERTAQSERKQLVKRHRAGSLRALVSVNALSVGFDSPGTDLVALLRATRSPVFYVQAAGRGMRTAPGKDSCTWLDFTDTTERLGPVDRVSGRAANKTRRPPEGPVFKVCNACGAQNPPGVVMCRECATRFEIERINHTDRAADAAVMSGGSSRFEVTNVQYRRHRKPGSPDSMRVEYFSGPRKVIAEWVCVEHKGPARAMAEFWWRKRAEQNAPASVEDALMAAEGLKVPAAIHVVKKGKFPAISKVEWPS